MIPKIKTWQRAYILSVTALTLTTGFEALAQEKSKNTTLTLPKVTVTTANLPGDVVGYKTGVSSSSTRTETPLVDVPQSISVVTQDQIRDQNITSMEEAVRYVPGVNIQQGESNRDAVTIRGNASTADFFIDGARDDTQYYRDFYNIDRIEFLKGPNAMAFGRGGSGGLINRISKFADGKRKRQVVLTGGSFNNRRAEADIGDKVNDSLSLRLNTMYENTETFRQFGDMERFGFNPTATVTLDKNTDLKVGYEYFKDQRFNDRGLPSSNGYAYKTNPKTFFGNPNENTSEAEVNSVFANLTHKFSPTLEFKNYTRLSNYNKFYNNVYASDAVQSNGDVPLSAYNLETDRNNFTNQTDLIKKFSTGSVKHTALFGTEVSRQNSTNLRVRDPQSINVSVSNPITYQSFNYSEVQAHNSSEVDILATYLQDQIDLTKHLQLTAGLRFDRFDIKLKNKLTSTTFQRSDNLISPRLGLVLKPQENLSFYTSYSVSYLPSSGDQFNSLDSTTQTLKPEELQNYEIGSKWDVNNDLSLAAAIYQLNRTNTRSIDPNDSSRTVLNGESQTRGLELSATGKITEKMQLIAGFTHQKAKIVNPTGTGTSSLTARGTILQLTPRNKFTLWNKYDFTEKFAAGLGFISQSSQFASTATSSTPATRLKGFNRFDAAAYYKINADYRVQVNVENLFNREYILTAHNNNNLQPGSTRAVKVSLTANF